MSSHHTLRFEVLADRHLAWMRGKGRELRASEKRQLRKLYGRATGRPWRLAGYQRKGPPQSGKEPPTTMQRTRARLLAVAMATAKGAAGEHPPQESEQ